MYTAFDTRKNSILLASNSSVFKLHELFANKKETVRGIYRKYGMPIECDDTNNFHFAEQREDNY